MSVLPAPLSAAAVAPSARSLSSRVVGQAALLMSGYALAQACSLLRNAVIGYCLSKGDFGVAATITIALQMLETLSDLGAERLIVQASDGDDPRLMAAAHTTLVLRGIVTGAILFVAAGVIVDFFSVPQARWAFEVASLVPLIKGFTHLGSRLQQRGLNNFNTMVIEVVPQAVALALVIPAVNAAGNFSAVVWLAILQAVVAVLASHLLSARGYALGVDLAFVKRLFVFGWPIWLSAIPLVAIYQGDRIIIGHFIGIEALGSYSAAFMIAMVPGLIAAKVGHALMLPLLAEKRNAPTEFVARYVLMFEGTSIAAAAYLVVFVLAGGSVLPLVFGPNYIGLDAVMGWLAAMWALRMVQSVPGIALMAQGITRPLLLAGLLRALALVLALIAVLSGMDLAGVAAAGVVGELASLIYITTRIGRGRSGLTRTTLLRALYPMAIGLLAVVLGHLLPDLHNPWLSVPAASVVAVSSILAGLALMPSVREFLEAWLDQRKLSVSRRIESQNAERQT